MAAEETTTPGPWTSLPTAEMMGAAFTEGPEKAAEQAAAALAGIAADLVAGKSPLQSNTLRFNVPQVIVGLVGIVWSAYAGGHPETLYPSIVLFANGAINSFLRTLTSGPIISQGVNGIMNGLAALPAFKFEK